MSRASPAREGLSERQERILAWLERTGAVGVGELAQALGVSEVTVRKDLQELEERSFLTRTHGGAVRSHRSKFNLSLGDKLARQPGAKDAIARAAVALVHDGDTVLLDAGSTTLALARLLPGRFRGLTVITNSLPIVAELTRGEGIEVISVGGVVRAHSLAQIGPLAALALSRLTADRAFLGATGATLERGLSTPNLVEAETKRAMLEAAPSRYALLDGSKLGRGSLAAFARWEELSGVITDRDAPEAFLDGLRERGLDVTVAAEGGGA